jgi:cobalt/nickel transport system permease protein
MHIPDGYLSPETCATLYAASAPFWYVALRRVRKLVSTRFLPLISVFASFSFVIMMFNLPLPGGTTGHAVGVGIATVVLGPWASILAISTALVIQSVFFGDGGVTAIGANCFNMAITGSLTAYAVYRLLAHGSGLRSRRRVVAAATAGYAAINVSALFAAVEFGLQPLLFHDAAGTPLYCPYPLSISIPAMMIGHLTFAGLAELVVTGGVVAYLQRADPALLMRTAPDAPDRDSAPHSDAAPHAGKAALPNLRRLWLGLAVLLILTPLGILAAGSAWGEWTAQDFADPGMRRQIGAASSHQAPPTQAPRGLERLSSVWTAPLSRYAPGFIRNPSFGYLVSAMVGVGSILLVFLLLNAVLARRRPATPVTAPATGKFRRGFIGGTVKSLFDAIQHALFAEQLARIPGFLQSLDPRVKVAGIGLLIIATATVHRLPVVALLFLLAVGIAIASHVPAGLLISKIWLPALSFSGVIALPAIFLTAGTVLYRLPLLHWPVSRQGLFTAALLLLRVETAATFSALLVLTTEWTRVLRALRFFHVPVTAVVILGMTYRYVFLMLRTAQEMFESRQSRLVGTLEPADRRRLAAASVGVLLSKSFQLSAEVHDAMRARGYQGEIYLLDEPSLHAKEWMQVSVCAGIAVAAIGFGL